MGTQGTPPINPDPNEQPNFADIMGQEEAQRTTFMRRGIDLATNPAYGERGKYYAKLLFDNAENLMPGISPVKNELSALSRSVLNTATQQGNRAALMQLQESLPLLSTETRQLVEKSMQTNAPLNILRTYRAFTADEDFADEIGKSGLSNEQESFKSGLRREEEVIKGAIALQKKKTPQEININNDTGNLSDKAVGEFEKKDVVLLNEARDSATEGGKILNLYNAMERVMDEGFDTGRDAPVKNILSSIGEVAGYGGEFASQFEDFNSMSKELGAQTLQLFGGNDTERELLVALETQPSTTNTEEGNRRILSRKKKAIEILSTRPDFIENWLQDNGSTAAKNSEGKTFTKAWMDRQEELFNDSRSGERVDQQASGRSQQQQLIKDPASIASGRAAINAGADRNAVINRLINAGVDPEDL
jgi:hypothetical protein